MAFTIRRVDYFYTTVRDRPGEAYQLLTELAKLGVNLLAFNAFPTGPTRTQMALFPNQAANLAKAAEKTGMVLDGPHPALLVQGDDELGALATIHDKLHGAQVSVFASYGVTDGKGSYGYVVYVRPEEFDKASSALAL